MRFSYFDGLGIYTSADGNGNSDSPSVNITCRNLFSHVTVDYPTEYFTRNYVGTAEVTSFGEIGEFVELNFSGSFDIFSENNNDDTEQSIEEGVTVQGYMRLIRKN